MITLHLSKPTISTTILNWKSSLAAEIVLKTKNLKPASKKKTYYYPLNNPQIYENVSPQQNLKDQQTNKASWIFLALNASITKVVIIIGYKNGKESLSFAFKSKNKSVTWYYKLFFSCYSKDVLYILISDNCVFFYIGSAEKLKQRTGKHRSDVIHPNHNDCK